jgi:uncharacterized HAD superfamily protein
MKIKKKKAVCCDLDDTISNFLKTLCHIHNVKNNTCLSDNDITDWDFEKLNITDARGNTVNGKNLRETYKYFEDHGLYAILSPLDYAKYALDTAHEIGYTVIILTARPEKYKAQTELNLISQDIYYDEIYYEWDKCKKLDELSLKYNIIFFADDKVNTVQAVAKNCQVKNCFLINKPYNKNVILEEDSNIVRVNDLMDCIKELKKVNKGE